MAIDAPASTTFTKLPHVSRRLAGQTMLFGIDSPHELPIRLNASGSELWDRLDLADDTAVHSPDELTLLETLIDHGVLEAAPSSAATPQLAVPKNAPNRPAHVSIPRDTDLWEMLRTFDPTDDQPPQGPSFESLAKAEALNTNDLVDLVEKRGAIGQLAHAIDGGFIHAEPSTRDLVQERWAANQLHCLRVEQLLVRVARTLDDAGIEFRVLKGVAVAHLDYRDPSYREFGDADVLIRRVDYHQTVMALTSADLDLSELIPYQHPFAKKGTTLITTDRLMIDCRRP